MRQPDIIDVNREWGVWVGSRQCGYLVGTVLAATRSLAARAARAAGHTYRISIQERP